jgi:phosphatidyl-myo-inositol alpha-mannosyltransferase
MKIGLVAPYDYAHPGGVVAHVSYLAHHLQKLGQDVKIIAPIHGKGAQYYDEEITAVGRPLPITYGGTTARIALSPWLPFQIKRVLDKEQFNIIHLHEPFIPMLCLSTLAQSKTVNVGTFHAYHERSAAYWLGQPIMRNLGKKLHGKIAVSRPALNYISRYLPAEYTIIPNGVNTQHYRQEGPVLDEYKDGKLNILFVGRLEPRKGVADLIHACSIVKEQFSDFRLIIAGPGIKMRYQYELLAKRLLNNHAVFTKFIPFEDLPKYYRTADIFCSPATSGESFGIVLLEAMASGKPVVATNIPGYASVLTHGKEGLLAEPKNPRSLAQALLTLLQDSSLRKKLAEQGLITAEQYSWENVSRQVLSYYESLAK